MSEDTAESPRARATSSADQPSGTTPPAASTSAPVVSPASKAERAEPSRSTEHSVASCSSEDAARWVAEKGRYSSPGNVYPAIEQGDDYGPIEAIQVFYAQAQASGAPPFGEFDVEQHAELSSDGSKITVTGQRGPVIVDLSEQHVRIGRRSFAEPKTISLFRTLAHLLADLGAQCKYQGIRGSRLRTRAYKDFVRIELSYGAIVVNVEAASNGRGNPERLYVLDLQESKDSFLWAHEEDDASGQ